MARGMGYGSMYRKKSKHASVTGTRRVKPLTAKRKRAGNVKNTSKKY